ncbi:MAG: ABC transporter substrate-binding protein, partial [Tardiphaga sp.]|nr:ABC transporter substrate-binding protein [Tardiphaga sp.]
MKRMKALATALALFSVTAVPAEAAKVRIGYWSSGISLGF